MSRIIERNRSIIPACDVELELYEEIVRETANIDGIGGYKIGFVLGLTYGLSKIVEVTRRYTNKPIIYDHQKACTDIPDTGIQFAKTCKNAGIDTVILFPLTGPEAERTWIKVCMNEGLGVIVGGLMSHPCYLRSEGGYISDESVLEIYGIAADLGVKDFVVPGTKLNDVIKIKSYLEEKGIKAAYYPPGFVTQGGSIKEAENVFGESDWHPIVGRAIYRADSIRNAAEHCVEMLCEHM